MILLRFNLKDFESCKSVTDVFRTMGIYKNDDKDIPEDAVRWSDKEVFGTKGYYRNLIMNDGTYNKIREIMEKVPNYKGRKNPKNRLSYAASQWINYSPLSSGSRYAEVKKLLGLEDVPEDVLVIVTPEDDIYEEDPTLGEL